MSFEIFVCLALVVVLCISNRSNNKIAWWDSNIHFTSSSRLLFWLFLANCMDLPFTIHFSWFAAAHHWFSQCHQKHGNLYKQFKVGYYNTTLYFTIMRLHFLCQQYIWNRCCQHRVPIHNSLASISQISEITYFWNLHFLHL